MTCWRESQIRRIGEADKMTCKQKRPEKEALSGTSCDRGRYGDGYGDVSATISATSHRCALTVRISVTVLKELTAHIEPLLIVVPQKEMRLVRSHYLFFLIWLDTT
jgi:hypothetical protein